MGHYHRLTLMEREELSRLLAAGYSLRATAHALQRAPSTLSRESKWGHCLTLHSANAWRCCGVGGADSHAS